MTKKNIKKTTKKTEICADYWLLLTREQVPKKWNEENGDRDKAANNVSKSLLPGPNTYKIINVDLL